MSIDSHEATFVKILWHNPDRFNPAGLPSVGARTSDGRLVIGPMRKPHLGERYRLWGAWQAQKPRGSYPAETAFKFEHHEVIIDSSESGVAHFLSQHVEGIGPVRAAALVAALGVDTLAVLRSDPEKALEVEGITPAIVDAIERYWQENPHVDPAAYARLADLFAPHKFPRRIVNTLIRDFGSDAPQVVTDRPYMLLAFPGLGWAKVDEFAVQTARYPKDGTDRHKAALVEALERIASAGHTFAARAEVESQAFALVNSRPTEEAWATAQEEGLIASRPEGYCLPKLAVAEETIARRIAQLSRAGNHLPFSLPDEGLLEGQRDALYLLEEHPVVNLVGPPGTGKTYTVGRILKGCIDHGYLNIRVIAPTGKAAKRADEMIQAALPGSPIECSTIHKALAPTPSGEPEGVPASAAKINRGRREFGFGKGEDDPIEADLIVVDEASMVDVSLGASLLRAVKDGTRLVIVGDPNQLPSVGPGSFLRDLIAGGVPTARLSEVQRNCGTIVEACHAILRGDVPKPADEVDIDGGKNWIHVECEHPDEIAETVVSLHESARKNRRFDPNLDMQAISPEKGKEGVGCDELNQRLAHLLNPYRAIDPAPVERSDVQRGDKIIRVKNGLADLMKPVDRRDDDGTCWRWDEQLFALSETPVVNGDMGEVRDIVKGDAAWHVVVQFRSPDRLCRLPMADAHIQLAYAITTHKAQGSGVPYVICPVHNSFFYNPKTHEGLWNREMFYTMASRAEKLLVTVGSFSAIESAVSRKTVNRRRTRLASLVSAAIAPQPAEELSCVEA